MMNIYNETKGNIMEYFTTSTYLTAVNFVTGYNSDVWPVTSMFLTNMLTILAITCMPWAMPILVDPNYGLNKTT